MQEQMLVDVLVFAFGVTSVVALTRIVKYWLARRDAAAPIADLNARLARIEQVVETTAIEVERVAEAHRFTTKLLTQRGDANAAYAAPRPERIITPH